MKQNRFAGLRHSIRSESMETNKYSFSRMDKIALAVVVAIFVLGLAWINAYADVPPDAPVADAAEVVASDAPVAAAAPVLVNPESDILGAIKAIIESARAGNWKLVTALLLAFAMVALNRVRGKIKWFAGDRGGAVLVMSLGFLGALSTALAAGMAVDAKLLWGAFSTSLLAAGGYNWFKRIIWPEDQGKHPPAWMELKPPAQQKKKPAKKSAAKVA